MITKAICPVMVGRETELTILEDALLAACRGEGGVVALSGDAGLGKTRLATELRRRAEKVGCSVMEGSCSEAELTLPYLPFLEAVGNFIAEQGPESLRQQLGPAATDLSRLFPQLGAAPPADDSESTQGRLRIFEAFLAVLRLAAEERALLLVLEDLHWADASTRELLDYLTRRLRTTRILVLATFRRDEMHRRHPLLPTVQGWRRSGLAQVVDLEPLEPEGVSQMVGAIFDHSGVSDEFRDFLHVRTEGNPFVLEEMLRSALDRGDIFRADEGWQRRDLSELRLPPSVRDTILMRVERLPEAQQDVLRAAAVLGRSFEPRLLAAISGQPRAAVEQAMEAFTEQQFVERDPALPGRHRFRHALTQEAVYDSLSALRAERLHGAAADALLSDGDPPALELAEHLEGANRQPEAVPVLVEAAASAFRAHAHRAAADLYLRALPGLTAEPDRAPVLASLGRALLLDGDAKGALEYLEAAVAGLVGLGSDREAGAAMLDLGRCHWLMNRPPAASEVYERARQLLEPLGPSLELANYFVRTAGMHLFKDDGPGSVANAERAIAVATEVGADSARIWAYNFLGAGLAYQGNFAEGLAHLDRSYREAVAAGYDDIAANALNNGIVCRWMAGRFRDTLPMIAQLRRSTVAAFAETAPILEGFVNQLLGNLAAARANFEEITQRISEFNTARTVERAVIGSTELAIITGHYAEAAPRITLPANIDMQEAVGRLMNWIEYHLALGDAQKAAQVLDSLTLEDYPSFFFVTPVIARVLLEAGRIEEARAYALHLSEHPLRDHPLLRLALAQVAIADRELARAAELLEPAIKEMVANSLMDEIEARAVAVDLEMARDDRTAAQDHLTRGLEFARRIGARTLESRLEKLALRYGLEPGTSAPSPVVAAAETLDTTPAEVGGAAGEKLVTVLFADVRGYTESAATLSPQENADRISSLQRWAAQEVTRHHGVVDKFAGDAIMATFNVSGMTVDHAVHALQAALAIRDKAALGDVPVGVGLATGAAVVGKLAAGANLSVLGEATNLAARLQAAAGPGEVLLGSETLRRVRPWLEERGLRFEEEALALKGFENPVSAARLEAPAASD